MRMSSNTSSYLPSSLSRLSPKSPRSTRYVLSPTRIVSVFGMAYLTRRQKSRNRREAQRVLAEEITELVHGRQSFYLLHQCRPVNCEADESGEAVTKAKMIASVLYQRETRSLRSREIEGLVSVDPKSFIRLHWKEVKGVTISKLAVQLGLAKSRSKSPQHHRHTSPHPRYQLSAHQSLQSLGFRSHITAI